MDRAEKPVTNGFGKKSGLELNYRDGSERGAKLVAYLAANIDFRLKRYIGEDVFKFILKDQDRSNIDKLMFLNFISLKKDWENAGGLSMIILAKKAKIDLIIRHFHSRLLSFLSSEVAKKCFGGKTHSTLLSFIGRSIVDDD